MTHDSPAQHVAAPLGPVISAACDQVVITGTGFLPNHRATVRIVHHGDDVVDYLAYTSDADGHLSAALPAAYETGNITVTDHRPDPEGDCGLLWSNTISVRTART